MDKLILTDTRAQAIYKLISALRQSGHVRVGFNEAVKSLNSGTALLVLGAVDSEPPCLTEPLVTLCEQKGVKCVAVGSKTALGRACRVPVDVIACAVAVPKGEEAGPIEGRIADALGQ